MSLSTEGLLDSCSSTTLHPLVQRYESRLGKFVGVISRFIIQKRLEEWNIDSDKKLKKGEAVGIADSIILEAMVLIGPQKANSLKDEYMTMIDEYYKEDDADEQ